MARIFVTGSADGLGRETARTLLDQGHEVVLHARSTARLESLSDLIDRGAAAVTGDLADREQVVQVAEQVNRLGSLDAVVHNAGINRGGPVLAVNVVAPYLLTALVQRPPRLVYLSSGMHRGGSPDLSGQDWGPSARGSYSDSKLYVTALALAVARLWPEVGSNAVDPGWVPTRMGGTSAPDSLELGHRTQEWLATSEEPAARTSGGYWFHQERQVPHPSATNQGFQDRLLAGLAEATGVSLV